MQSLRSTLQSKLRHLEREYAQVQRLQKKFHSVHSTLVDLETAVAAGKSLLQMDSNGELPPEPKVLYRT